MISSSDIVNVRILGVDDLDLQRDQIFRAIEERAFAMHKSFNAGISLLSGI